MEKRKATIYDFARFCRSMTTCRICPLSNYNNDEGEVCEDYVNYYTDEVNEIIVDWCDKNPLKKRVRKS